MAPTIRGLGAVAPHVKSAAEEIAAKFRVYNIGGFATSGHISKSDHYTGHALDVMVFKDKAKGDMIQKWVFANWQRLGVKYVIWQRVYYPHPGEGETYTGSNPHTDHVHISFLNKPGDGPAVDVGSDQPGCLSILRSLGLMF